MKALVVCGRGPDWNDVMLYRACRELLGPSRIVRACDLSAYVGPDGLRFWHGSRELSPPDVCFIRSLGPGNHEQLVSRSAVLRALASSGSLVVNPVQALEKVRDKFSALMALREVGFSIPRTLLTESAYLAYSFSRSMPKFVFKPLTGSLGLGSMLFQDEDLAFNILKLLESKGCPLHLQEFVGDVKRELRVFVINGEVVACVEKMAPGGPGSWRRNVALGARVLEAETPGELEKLCLRALEKLGLFYAGIDVLEVGSSFVALEVNGAPNWRGVQEATGKDIARLLVLKVKEMLKT